MKESPMNTRRLSLAALLLSVLASPLANAALIQLFKPPAAWPYALSAISGDGSTLLITPTSNASDITGGWLWRSSSGFVPLPAGIYPWHGGISQDGSLIAGTLPNVGAFRFDTRTNQFSFPPVNSPETRTLALSEDGAKVLLSTSEGVFIWNGDSQSQIATGSATSGSISNDGRAAVFLSPSGYNIPYLWTEAGGLQQLPAVGYVRNLLISADGTRVVALQYEYRLNFWQINAAGTAIGPTFELTRNLGITGASPDCSIIGLSGYFYTPTVWSSQSGLSTIESLLAGQGASPPFGGPFTSLIGASSNNRILAGTTYLPTPEGFGDPRIWLVDLDRSCPAEFTFDAQVDDADFVLFAAAYDEYLCPDPEWGGSCFADFNADGFVDDADFVVFAQAYDNLTCP